MNIGDAKIVITADDKASAQMNEVGKSTNKLGINFKALGVALVAATAALGAFIFKATKDWAAAGDVFDKMTDRTGIAVEKLSELDYVLRLSGSSIEDFEKANKKLSATIQDAGYGLETYTRAFDELGLDIAMLQKLSPEEQFWAVAHALAEIDNESNQIALAQDLFGRAGTALLPMLADGADAIAEMQAEYNEYGYQWTEQTAGAAAALNDSVQKLEATWDKIKFKLIEELDIESRIDALSEWMNKAGDWLSQNKDMLDTFIEAVKILGTALFYIWKAFKLIGEIIANAVIAGMRIMDFILPGKKAWMTYAGDYDIAMPTPEALDLASMSGSNVASASGGGTTINLNGPFVGNESAFQEFARTIDSAIGQNNRRTSFGTVNPGYYGGTSAP